MGEEIAISLQNVSKCYKRYGRPVDRLREVLLPQKSYAQEFWALKDISLEVPKGQTVGIVGQNGSGKSTLLQIIAGTLTPTTGEIAVRGRVSALLELGSGFNPEFTGRQNIFFNARLLGMNQGEIEDKFDDIAAFADIGDFLDQPVKTYSSGMYVRLAFSVAINVDPQIMIVDEALAVGDARFQQRCMTRINQLRNSGISVLFVSHDAEAVKRLCDYAIVLEKGTVVNRGVALDMVSWYLALMTVDFDIEKVRQLEKLARIGRGIENNDISLINSDEIIDETHIPNRDISNIINNADHLINDGIALNENRYKNKTDDLSCGDNFKYFRHGDGQARITKTWIVDEQEEEIERVYLGSKIKVYIEVEFLSNQSEYLIGVLVRDRLGTDIIGINTYQENIELAEVVTGDKYLYCFQFEINIRPGVYSISPSVAYDQYRMPWLDWVENAVIFQVVDPEPKRLVFGLYHPPERNVIINKLSISEDKISKTRMI
ncbi:ABC transporter ATP-binding protein [Plectonema cf. radiosum LEGE 06105]|uniref:ABC transporter ATP-binding protein n=1 Tax=Plectonema cf. radiosum LEGE 06105 TaxID=945769 RepID=A0A8J7F3E0_9CYAN|nr:ABC transporter ATP-binding protein [Plectonema radiosum]MBE9215518.1 ABC transporter ATP-binding protein [Plectonema cf. radiosum LEGE 06105]